MISIAGFIFLLVCVFGGYILAGGKMEIILLALPFEFAIIGGAAVGALLMANSMSEVKHIFGSFGKILKGGKYKRQDYMELLSLLFWLVRLAQTKSHRMAVVRARLALGREQPVATLARIEGHAVSAFATGQATSGFAPVAGNRATMLPEGDAQFDDLGLQALKNIAEPLQVFRLRLGEAEPAALALRCELNERGISCH